MVDANEYSNLFINYHFSGKNKFTFFRTLFFHCCVIVFIDIHFSLKMHKSNNKEDFDKSISSIWNQIISFLRETRALGCAFRVFSVFRECSIIRIKGLIKMICISTRSTNLGNLQADKSTYAELILQFAQLYCKEYPPIWNDFICPLLDSISQHHLLHLRIIKKLPNYAKMRAFLEKCGVPIPSKHEPGPLIARRAIHSILW